MSTLLPFLIAGLTTGSVYGLAGVGLVLTYKTSKVFNFAHGALATVSAFLFYTLHVRHQMPWPAAALICLAVGGPVLGLALEAVVRSLGSATLPVRVASTVGILLVVEAVVDLIYGTSNTFTVPVFLGGRTFHVGSTAVGEDQVVIWVVGMAATAALYVFFRACQTGVAMRAVVDNPELLDLAGTSPVRVRRWAWAIGVTLAAASGLLLAQLITLDATNLTLLVVQAFGAAAIGSFASLPGTYAGGLAIGIGASLCTKFFTSGLLAQLPPALPFLILFAVLLVMPKRRLAERAVGAIGVRSSWTAPLTMQVPAGVAVLLFLAFVPSFAGIHLTDWTLFLAGVITFLSLGLLVRTSGQVSLCQVTFTAIGAAAFSHLATGWGVPWLAAVLLAGLIAVPVGALLAVPAIRLSGLYLALSTFGFGIFVSYMFYSQRYMFGATDLGLQSPRPYLSWVPLNSNRAYYYVVLAAAVLATLFVAALVRGRLGRLLRALADSPDGLSTSGASTQITRVLVFCLSAFLAAVAGALGAGALSTVTADNYQPLVSVLWFAIVIIAVGGAPWYGLVASAGVWIVPSYLTSPETTYWLELLFGVLAVTYSITPEEWRAVPVPIARYLERFRPARVNVGDLPGPPASATPTAPAKLKVDQLVVTFGGLVAVDGVNLEAGSGRITGLIGPNGAGKTTTFNACSGLNRPSSGAVVYDGRDLRGTGPSTRARLGLGRTFQQMELFHSMTVRENVELGAEAHLAGLNPLSHIAAAPGQKRSIAASAAAAIEICGLSAIAGQPAGALSTGQRRLVELARCLAGPHRLLLLDEPSSGLDRTETVQFGQILRRAVTERSLGVLLVEHDMSLVTAVCDYIYVLDFGKPVFEGTPAEVMASEIVQAAYLGVEGSSQIEAAASPGRGA